MKTLTIGNKDYTLEYTIEASLYSECTEKVINLMNTIGNASDTNEIKDQISAMADIPQTALTVFYAGLLEHHGEEGDGTILSKNDAKKLIKVYLKEHKEDGTGNFYNLLTQMMEIMGDDDFFEQIGLGQAEEKETKKPQDHKKKQTAKVGEK
jgi:hypothetical protein